MRQVIREPNFKIYIVYSLTFTLLGIIITGLGPLIPYLAFYEHHEEYQYSFLFVCRAVGYVIGSLLIKIVEKHLKLHRLIIISLIFSGFFVFFSLAPGMYSKGFLIFLGSVGNSWIDITINICIIELFQTKNLNQWMQICHGAFGVGGLIGPIFVYQLQLHTYSFLGFFSLLLIPFYLFEKSPEDKIIQEGNEEMEEMNNRPHKPITNTQISYMCLIFLLLVGQESAFGGWISSFAVMSGFSTKEGATVYSSMYWGFVTLFRFLLPFVEGKSSIKLLLLFTLAIVGSLFSLAILHTIDPIVGMALSGIFLGISNSIAFPQTLTLPHQFNYKLTTIVNSNFMLFASIGDGTFPVFTGLLMKAISPDMLFYFMALMNVGLFYLVWKVVENFKGKNDQSQDRENLIELEAVRRNREIG